MYKILAYGPKKMRTVLLEMYTALPEVRTALLESMRLNDTWMQNFVFSNVSKESEYSDSELFYPFELSYPDT